MTELIVSSKTGYLSLEKLKVYQLSRELSRVAWEIYDGLSWPDKKIMGDQFIEATDSIGANLAEGYGRYHFLDKRKFYFNSRGSLLESRHWFDLLLERKKINDSQAREYSNCYGNLHPGLNGLIASIQKVKENPNI